VGETLDKSMAVYMAAPRTYTGEDIVEFHLHGSPVVCDLAVRLATQQGARLAEPGEFTQRAFLHGKLDLAQAESVLDLIESRTRAQARLAAQHLDGRFSHRVDAVRGRVLAWLTLLEAEIDFGDDIDNLPDTEHLSRLEEILSEVRGLLQDAHQGRVSVQGLKTVLVGAPNAGKSSLLNACLQEDRALVTPIAGTTRDRIDVDCQLGGVLFSLTDTAGLRARTDDEVERLGMKKTEEAVETADFVVLVIDSHQPELPKMKVDPDFVLFNKSDLEVYERLEELRDRFPQATVFHGELLTESGREAVVDKLVEVGRKRLTTLSGECFSLNQRHRESLVRCQECLLAVKETLEQDLSVEFMALDLRRAAEFLGQILGLDITEEVLDRIFGQFCLGK
jgi:tRNA modification GTPase